MRECIELMIGIAIMFFAIGVIVGEAVGKMEWRGDEEINNYVTAWINLPEPWKGGAE